jgi:hypothetical protein
MLVFPLGQPCSNTGLWPYPKPDFGSADTMVFSSPLAVISPPNTYWSREVFTFRCELNCDVQLIRSIIQDNNSQIPHNISYSPLYSSINFYSSIDFPYSIGLETNVMWIGNYGSHGNEFVMFRYGNDPSGNTQRPCLICQKITGDINVPRGEITFWAYIDEAFKNMGDQFKLDDTSYSYYLF